MGAGHAPLEESYLGQLATLCAKDSYLYLSRLQHCGLMTRLLMANVKSSSSSGAEVGVRREGEHKGQEEVEQGEEQEQEQVAVPAEAKIPISLFFTQRHSDNSILELCTLAQLMANWVRSSESIVFGRCC
uniref:GG17112 n=1 Tax=Drosophila erecta TaxID=7220 RepID=B3P493_DROER